MNEQPSIHLVQKCSKQISCFCLYQLFAQTLGQQYSHKYYRKKATTISSKNSFGERSWCIYLFPVVRLMLLLLLWLIRLTVTILTQEGGLWWFMSAPWSWLGGWCWQWGFVQIYSRVCSCFSHACYSNMNYVYYSITTHFLIITKLSAYVVFNVMLDTCSLFSLLSLKLILSSSQGCIPLVTSNWPRGICL